MPLILPVENENASEAKKLFIGSYKKVMPESQVDMKKLDDESYVSELIIASSSHAEKVGKHNMVCVLSGLYFMIQNGCKTTCKKTIEKLIELDTPVIQSIRKEDYIFRLGKYFKYMVQYPMKTKDFIGMLAKDYASIGDGMGSMMSDDAIGVGAVITDVLLNVKNNKYINGDKDTKETWLLDVYKSIEKKKKFSIDFMDSLKSKMDIRISKLAELRQTEIEKEKEALQLKIKKLDEEANEIIEETENDDLLDGIRGGKSKVSQKHAKFSASLEKLANKYSATGGGMQQTVKYVQQHTISKILELSMVYYVIEKNYGQSDLNQIYQIMRAMSLKLNDGHIGFGDVETGEQSLGLIRDQLDKIGAEMSVIVVPQNKKEDEQKAIELAPKESKPSDQKGKYKLSLKYDNIGYSLDILYTELAESKDNIQKIKKYLKKYIYKTTERSGLNNNKNTIINNGFRHKFFGNDNKTITLGDILLTIETGFKEKKWI